MYNAIFADNINKELNFSLCNFLRPNAVAFIGGIVRYSKFSRIKVTINWDSVSDTIRMNLAQNGFIKSHIGEIESWEGNSVPYREDNLADFDEKAIIDHLLNNWLSFDRINLSKKLKNDIVDVVLEVFINAKEHSETKVPIISCGQYYPRLKELCITVIDFGIGIPENVRKYNNDKTIKAGNALKWAFALGASTAKEAEGRGNGLNRLSNFIEFNEGKMFIFSHAGSAITTKSGTEFTNFKDKFFPGTIVSITMKCSKDTFYSYSEE
ncbi:MAG: ATP-binding protein [Balneola sp.]